MDRQSTALKTLRAVFTTLLVGVAWFLFIPTQFGGQTAYAIVNGNSMEPTFQRGDLVILRTANSYHIGDIATYRHPEIGPVIHRIIGQEQGHFIFQGDHNKWIDSYQPKQDEIIGKLWWHVPKAGTYLGQVRQPWLISLLAMVIVVFGTISIKKPEFQRPQPSITARGGFHPMEYFYKNKSDLIFLAAIPALATLLLTIFAFVKPVTQSTTTEVPYQQTGKFSYAATAPPGIYLSDQVKTGEPIFRQLINQTTINFEYHFSSDLPATVNGMSRLVLGISHQNGWTWLMELQPATAFDGNEVTLSGVVDLPKIQAIINNLEQQTGLLNQKYTLTITPEIIIAGTLAGQAINDQFSPQLSFQLDPLQMQVIDPSLNRPTVPSPFAPSQSGSVQKIGETTNVLALPGFEIEVQTARLIGILGLIGSLLGLGLIAWLMTQAPAVQAATQLQQKYGSLLVTVDSLELETMEQVIEMSNFEDLVKIAERSGRMILHKTQANTHHYLIRDDTVAYRYRLVDSQPVPQRPSPMVRVKSL